MCPTYNFWYRKIITAENIKKAIKQENKHKLRFDSIVEQDESVKAGTDAIGFEYSPSDEE